MKDKILRRIETLKSEHDVSLTAINKVISFIDVVELPKCPKLTSAPNKGVYVDFKIRDDNIMLRFNDVDPSMITISDKTRFIKDFCTLENVKDVLKHYGVILENEEQKTVA